ncbi:MAG: TraR/DksA family transcriptional regulator [Candidatus Cloacimonas sp.]|nr:TraR/DksA family transcriptional regulator [Candidatus Cloacimonadota bacterium]
MAKPTYNKVKLKQFEEELLQEREETMKVIRDINAMQRRGVKDSGGDLSSYSTHQADQGTDSDTLEKEVFLLESMQEKLRNVNLALNRIYEGKFGICEMCHTEIEEARLKVVPYANMCIDCKTEEENKRNKKR